MHNLIGFIEVLLIVLVLGYSLIFFVQYFFHLKSTKENVELWDYASFDEFKEHFNKYNWTLYSSTLLLDSRSNCRVDKFVTHFENKGIAFNPKDFFLYMRFLKKTCKAKLAKRQGNLWSQKLRVVK